MRTNNLGSRENDDDLTFIIRALFFSLIKEECETRALNVAHFRFCSAPKHLFHSLRIFYVTGWSLHLAIRPSRLCHKMSITLNDCTASCLSSLAMRGLNTVKALL